MAWQIERNGGTLHVSVSAPVGDWEALLDDLETALEPRPSAIVLPSHVDNGTDADARSLQLLWKLLSSRGFSIQRPAE
jgi:alpha/beta superfamily hydrolase